VDSLEPYLDADLVVGADGARHQQLEGQVAQRAVGHHHQVLAFQVARQRRQQQPRGAAVPVLQHEAQHRVPHVLGVQTAAAGMERDAVAQVEHDVLGQRPDPVVRRDLVDESRHCTHAVRGQPVTLLDPDRNGLVFGRPTRHAHDPRRVAGDLSARRTAIAILGADKL